MCNPVIKCQDIPFAERLAPRSLEATDPPGIDALLRGEIRFRRCREMELNSADQQKAEKASSRFAGRNRNFTKLSCVVSLVIQ